MFNLDLSYRWLYWTRPSTPTPLAPGIERHWLETPGGRLELLANKPTSADGLPILFCHGGMGGAWVWNEYLAYLAAEGVQAYAVSLRGHGSSWSPSFFKMVFGTSRAALGDDLVAAVDWVRSQHGDLVLVGHSAGGGLSQDMLSRGRVQAVGLGLLGAVPGFGSWVRCGCTDSRLKVNSNWLRLDPWFNIRHTLQLLHPNSPLSHPKLTKRAFFSDAFPLTSVVPFQERMCRFESYQWAFSTLFGFAKAENVLKSQTGSGVRLLVMAGEEDKLMTPEVTRETVAWYRTASDDSTTVRMELVPGAAHHLQNDVQWEDSAARLLDWYRSLKYK